jgi:hypothetical protein
MPDAVETKDECPWSARPKTVERVATAKLPTKRGDFMIAGYRSLTSNEEFVVLYKGEMDPDVPTLVRIDTNSSADSRLIASDVFDLLAPHTRPAT